MKGRSNILTLSTCTQQRYPPCWSIQIGIMQKPTCLRKACAKRLHLDPTPNGLKFIKQIYICSECSHNWMLSLNTIMICSPLSIQTQDTAYNSTIESFQWDSGWTEFTFFWFRCVYISPYSARVSLPILSATVFSILSHSWKCKRNKSYLREKKSFKKKM